MTKKQLSRLFATIFVFLFFDLHADYDLGQPALLSTTDGNPSSFVAGYVSTIDGTFFNTEIDMVIPGPLPIVCSRSYNSHSKRWDFYPGSYMQKSSSYFTDDICSSVTGIFSNYDGSCFTFKSKTSKLHVRIPDTLTLHPKHLGKGFTNTGKGYIGGKTNLFNHQYDYQNSLLKYGDGTQARYVESCRLGGLFFASRIDFPNRSSYHFDYAADKDISKLDHFARFIINAENREGKIYGQAWLNHAYYLRKQSQDISLHSLKDDRSVSYRLDSKKRSLLRPIIHGVKGSNIPDVHYLYNKDGLLTRKFYPETGRSLEIMYDKKKRVSKLLVPIGANGTLTSLYTFKYLDKRTIVYDPLDHMTIYDINNESRLLFRSKLGREGKYFSIEGFDWHKNDSAHPGCLKNYFLQDQNQRHYTKSFLYDNRHNIINETVEGAISSENGIDSYVKYFTYSNDGFNNFLSEADHRLTIQYTYFPQTNLVSSKFFLEKGNILRRIFYRYDNTGSLIEEVEDDGNTQEETNLSHVTQRLIKKITPNPEAPCLGMPAVIENYALDISSGTQILITKEICRYTKEGLLQEKEVYDANSIFQYRLKSGYDRFGNSISETDPLGNEALREFDPNGNKTWEQNSKGNLQIRSTFDLLNRCTKKIAASSSGKILEEFYEYDPMSNLKKSIDIYGNSTLYEYDELNRCSKKVSPGIYDVQGCLLTPEEHCSYDIFDNVCSYTDANGYIKTTSYNIFKQPLKEIFPDGTAITYEYESDGALRKETTKTGAYILYTHDAFKRVLTKKTYSPEHDLLCSQSFSYNAFHKLSETDSNGNTIFFEYDYAGRLCKQYSDQKITLTEYDSLGRAHLIKEKTGSDQWKITKKTFDLLNRITDERIEDEQGTLLYRASCVYDPDGNVLEKWHYSEAGSSINHFSYDGFNRLIRIETPLGEVFTIEYDDHFFNCHGQKVLRKIETDPMGQQMITVYNTHKKPNIIEKKDHHGTSLSRFEFFYDPVGNRAKAIETIFFQGNAEKTTTTAWYYNSVNKVIRWVQAEGSSDQKETLYTYNKYGQKEKIIKPNGVTLFHSYDPLGRLSALHSSDQTIDEEYLYDPNGNLIQCQDHVHHTLTTRKYNSQNELIEETLGNTIKVSYQRDPFGRIIEMTLPDGSAVVYQYDPLYVRSISYENVTHSYERYDLNGNILSEKLIGNGGMVHKTYDLAFRLTNIFSDYWKEENISYDSMNNLTSLSLSDSLGKTTNEYTYDSLYQLTSERGFHNHDYLYDSLHNRRLKDSSILLHNDLHQLLSQGSTQYIYDSNGNLHLKKHENQETKYDYDALDRLTSVVENGRKTTYIYDCFHRCIRRIISSDEKMISNDTFVYQDKVEMGIYNSSWEELRIFGCGIQKDVGAAVIIRIQGNTFAPVHDHGGNLSALIDPSSGNLIQSYRFTVFGEESLFDSSGDRLTETSCPWRFSSKRKEGSLIHFGLRNYDPEIGRWCSPDPLGYDEGPNLYAYVYNNPLTRIDPEGLSSFEYDAAIQFIPELSPTYGNGPIGSKLPPIEQKEPVIEYDPVFFNGHVNRGGGKTVEVGDREIPGHLNLFVNGFGNSLKYAIETTKMLSEMADNAKFTLVYNVNKGICNNLLRYSFSRMGYKETPTSLEVRRQCELFHKEVPYGRINIFDHSEGGTSVRNAVLGCDPELRKHIFVISIATSAYLERKYCGDVKYYESSRDFVPHVDSLGRYLCQESIITLTPHKDAPFFDHSIRSPTYTEVLKKEIKNITENPIMGFQEE